MRAAERYAERVALLVRVLPLLGDERDFALKGGTAINLFHRGMPRLSVDLDLTFLPVADREASCRSEPTSNHLSSMTHLQDVHRPCGIVDEIDDSVLPLPDPVHAGGASELLAPTGPCLHGQDGDSPNDPLPIPLRRDRFDLLDR